MSRYILSNGIEINTDDLAPHVECYFTDIVNGKTVLCCESIDGLVYSLGDIEEVFHG